MNSWYLTPGVIQMQLIRCLVSPNSIALTTSIDWHFWKSLKKNGKKLFQIVNS